MSNRLASILIVVAALSLAAGGFSLCAGEEGEKPPPSPIVRVKPGEYEGTRSGRLLLSNGKTFTGLIYTTPGKRLKIYDRKKKKVVEIDIRSVSKIEATPEVEKIEPVWRWKEAASDAKVYTGQFYPWRKLVTTIYLKNGKSITGDLAAPIYVLKEGEKKPKRFILHKRQKGGVGKKLKELLFVKKIEFGEFAPEENETEKEQQRQEDTTPETQTDLKPEQAAD